MAEFTGTAGDDSIVGTDRDDSFNFTLGNDTLIGGTASDSLFAEVIPLPDNVVVDLAAGALVGGGLIQELNSIENFYGLGVNATLRGTEGDNSLGILEAQGVVLEGRGGNDQLFFQGGGTGGYMSGGAGDDELIVVNAAGNVTVEGGAGTDTLDLQNVNIDGLEVTINSAGQYVLTRGTLSITLLDEVEQVSTYDAGEKTTASFAEFIAPFRPLTGTEAGEVIAGTSDSEQINAMGGNDWITTGGGADTIDGGAGIDMLSLADAFAQPGNAIRFSSMNLEEGYVQVNNPGPVGSLGNERSLISNIENLTGTSRADFITGDAGANILRGLGGRDSFTLSAGGDLMHGGAGRDTVRVAQGDTQDTAISLLRGRIWDGTGEGTRLQSIESIISGDGNDRLTGSHANNHIRAGHGDDVLMGLGGDDRLYGGFGEDVAIYGFAQDQYQVTTTGEVTTVSYIGAGAGDGTDTLLHIETLRFADGDLVL